MNTIVEIILYVKDQKRSKIFYEKVLRKQPKVDVIGMTEFELAESCLLGLMPNTGIAKILSDKMPHPDGGIGIPRCEIYLRVQDAVYEHLNAVLAGAREISPVKERDWGEKVGYVADEDGHVIAFASKL
jgi:lactoylglutathione lyase